MMIVKVWKVAGALAAMAVALAGCGQGPAEPVFDRAAWMSDARGAIGFEPADWVGVEQAGREACADDPDVLRYLVLTALEHGSVGTALLTHVNVQHMCPERSQEVETVFGEVASGY